MKTASNRKNKTTFTPQAQKVVIVKVVLFLQFEAIFMSWKASELLTKWWHFDNENSLSNCHDKFSFSKCRGRWGDYYLKIKWTFSFEFIMMNIIYKELQIKLDLHSVNLLTLLLSIERGLSWYIDPLDLIRISGKNEWEPWACWVLNNMYPTLRTNNTWFHANFL